jgi:hypothetical protein
MTAGDAERCQWRAELQLLAADGDRNAELSNAHKSFSCGRGGELVLLAACVARVYTAVRVPFGTIEATLRRGV